MACHHDETRAVFASLDHLVAFDKELAKAGVETDRHAPILLPEYRPQYMMEHMLDIKM